MYVWLLLSRSVSIILFSGSLMYFTLPAFSVLIFNIQSVPTCPKCHILTNSQSSESEEQRGVKGESRRDVNEEMVLKNVLAQSSSFR